MNERRIHIYSEKQCDQTFLIHGYLETQVDDTVINEIINNPISEVIQISDYISESTLRKLNEVFIKRPDIQFRVYDRIGCWPEFHGWNLQFLSLLPAVEKLCIDNFECLDTDFSVLQSLSGLKELQLYIFNVKDYSFVNNLPVQIESLTIDAEMMSGRAKFDCRWLLRFPLLHTLFFRQNRQELRVYRSS